MDTQDRIAVIAHEPGAGWITYAVVSSLEVAAHAETDALAEGFDAVVVAAELPVVQ